MNTLEEQKVVSLAATLTQGSHPRNESIPAEFKPKVGKIRDLLHNNLGHTSYLTRQKYHTFCKNRYTCACCHNKATHYLRLLLPNKNYVYGFFFIQGNYRVFLNLDHTVPLATGGVDTWKNIKTMCTNCNSFKADSIRPQQFILPSLNITVSEYLDMNKKEKIKLFVKTLKRMIFGI